MKPLVAIVGRANVGKSRLFNRLVGYTRAIVHDRSGVTRDRHYAPADWCGREFVVIDTGGIELDPSADLEKHVTKQSMAAIEEADVVVCLFDGRNPPTAEDEEIVSLLRRVKKPVVWCLNKIDEAEHERLSTEFSRLGLKNIISVSAEHGRRVDELLDSVVEHFSEASGATGGERDGLRISVIGKPNVGKSTLINRLCGSDRVVAHQMPGTTRDAIDVEIEFEGKNYVFVDTAGVKRGWKVSEQLEKFTSLRSLRTVERSQIVCQLIDAGEGLTKQDLSLSAFVLEEGKGLVVLVNKWDLMKADWREYEEDLKYRLKEFAHVPTICISAATGYHCLKVFEAVNRLNHALSKKLATSEVNRVVEQSLLEHHLPTFKGKEVRINYATQTGVYPPTFSLFSNFPAAVPYTYRRYLMHRLQEALGSNEIPVKIVCKRK